MKFRMTSASPIGFAVHSRSRRPLGRTANGPTPTSRTTTPPSSQAASSSKGSKQMNMTPDERLGHIAADRFKDERRMGYWHDLDDRDRYIDQFVEQHKNDANRTTA